MAARFCPAASPATTASSTSFPCSKPSARTRQARSPTTNLQQIEACAIPGPGSCGGMYTANTMASAIEALGMSLPNSSAQNAISDAKKDDCRRAGAAVVEMLKQRNYARSTS